MAVSSSGLGRTPGEKNGNHSSILAWRIPWTEGPGGLQSMGSQRVGHDWSDLACTPTSVKGGLAMSIEMWLFILCDTTILGFILQIHACLQNEHAHWMRLSSVKIARAWKQAQCLLIVNWLSQLMVHLPIKCRAAIKREDSLSDVEDLQGILSKKISYRTMWMLY